jgi:hypothetical protein
MKSRIVVWAAVLSAVMVLGCKSSAKKSALPNGQGFCADTCPKDCTADNDCDVTRGELCCDHPGVGRACQSAASCPRFCSKDTNCETNQACVRFSLEVESGVCDLPKNGLKLCTNDQSCDTGSKCCTIYSEPVCLPVDRCPKTCASGGDCNTSQGEICCTTLGGLDPTLAATGLCIDPNVVPCPRLCQQSSKCRTQDGEVCCNGVCALTCARKACSSSNDCQAQICCKSAVAAQSTGRPEGVPVPVHQGAGGTLGGAGGGGGQQSGTGGGSGAGGSLGTGGIAGVDNCLTSAAMIDDMEGGSGYICTGNGRVGYWFSYKDASSTLFPATVPAPPALLSPSRGLSLRGIHVTGSYFQYAGIGCFLNNTPTSLYPSTYNASRYTGVQFYAKGMASAPKVIVQTSATESTLYGGYCTLATLCAGNEAAVPSFLPETWTLVRVPFSSLGAGTYAFSSTDVWSVEFQSGPGLFDFWIDDLGFY